MLEEARVQLGILLLKAGWQPEDDGSYTYLNRVKLELMDGLPPEGSRQLEELAKDASKPEKIRLWLSPTEASPALRKGFTSAHKVNFLNTKRSACALLEVCSGRLTFPNRCTDYGLKKLLRNFSVDADLEILQQRYQTVLSDEQARTQWYFSRIAANQLKLIPALVGLCTVWFLASWAAPGPSSGDGLLRWGGLSPELVKEGETWRLWSATHNHLDILHLALNMAALYSMASLELFLGFWPFLVVYVLSGLGGSLLSFTQGSALMSAGASGAIFGLFGSAAYLGWRFRDVLPVSGRLHLSGGAAGCIVYNLIYGFTKSNVDNWAHLGGLLAGVAVTALIIQRDRGQILVRSLKPLGTLLLVMCLLASLHSLWFARQPFDLWAYPSTDINLGNQCQVAMPRVFRKLDEVWIFPDRVLVLKREPELILHWDLQGKYADQVLKEAYPASLSEIQVLTSGSNHYWQARSIANPELVQYVAQISGLDGTVIACWSSNDQSAEVVQADLKRVMAGVQIRKLPSQADVQALMSQNKVEQALKLLQPVHTADSLILQYGIASSLDDTKASETLGQAILERSDLKPQFIDKVKERMFLLEASKRPDCAGDPEVLKHLADAHDWNSLAWMHTTRGMHVPALAEIDRAVALSKGKPDLSHLHTRGVILLNLGRVAEAEKDLRAAYLGDKKKAWHALSWGEALLRLGKPQQARPLLEQAIQLSGELPTGAKAKALLKTI